jgi:hypothetical protein
MNKSGRWLMTPIRSLVPFPSTAKQMLWLIAALLQRTCVWRIADFCRKSVIRHTQVMFYAMLDKLEENYRRARKLPDGSRRFLAEERRVFLSDTGVDLRIVRVRTKALKAAFDTELWTRPLEHNGNWPGSGNHRGSIFRLLVGAA